MFLEIKGKPLLALEPGEIYLIGKKINGVENKPVNFIELEDQENVNERHCIIEVNHSEEAFVFDLLSSGGSLLNNNSLNSLKRTSLKNNDILKLGSQEIKYVHNRKDLSHDSSGFLEVNKNTSGIIDSSPDVSQQSRLKRVNTTNFLVPSIPAKKSITPTRSSMLGTEDNTSKHTLDTSPTLLNNRKSDSFTIPETQYCKPVNSLNSSNISKPESFNGYNASRIEFNFGNEDSFHDDDEFCIPETQDTSQNDGVPSSQRTRPQSDVHTNLKDDSFPQEEKEKSIENSQFRINTQDYNEGFGEEECVNGYHSQIIPLIKHQNIMFNNTVKSTNDNSMEPSFKDQEEKVLSSLKWSSSKADQNATRSDASTPDIFDFDSIEAFKEINDKNSRETPNTNPKITEEEINMMEEDEEDLLATQVFPAPSTKIPDKDSLKLLEKSCFEKEHEEVLTLSDKENRCPTDIYPISDIPPVQLLEVRPLTSIPYRSIASSSEKTNDSPKAQRDEIVKSALEMDADEEDDLLTQAFLQPSNPPTVHNKSSNKSPTIKSFNSTLLDDKTVAKPSVLSHELEKTPLKQITSPSTVFKKPDNDLGALKKTSSVVSETDMDLIMCTPQLIKDNIFLEKNDDLRKSILAVKNKNLFGGESEEEDEGEDGQGDLVKLVNIPKDSLDFDKLLPHLNKKPDLLKLNEKQKADIEAQKIYKFNISFGKEHEEKQSKAFATKTSSFSRDERHMARDKEKEMTRRKSRTEKANKNRHRKVDENTTESGSNDKQNSGKKTKPPQLVVQIKKLKEKPSDNEKTARLQKNRCSSEKIENTRENKAVATTEKLEKQYSEKEKNTRLRKKTTAPEKTDTAKASVLEQTPARRLTRSKSRLEEASTTSIEANKSNIMQRKEDDVDDIAMQRISRTTNSRSSSKNNEPQDSIKINSTSQKRNQNKDDKLVHDSHAGGKKSVERKRKADAATPAVQANMDHKRLRSTHTEADSTKSSASKPLTITMTMVDQELFKNLVTKSKGIWNIASNPAECDILVMDKAFRTFKFLLAMARGIPIVKSEYLNKINESQGKKAVRLSDYLFTDKEFEKKFKFSLEKSLKSARKVKIFKDYEFLMTPSILPNPKEIKAIIEASGGSLHIKTPPRVKENQKLYLITTIEDKKEWHKYRRLNKNIIIVSTEAIMTAVMRQNSEAMIKYILA